jgi:hypothetical protein
MRSRDGRYWRPNKGVLWPHGVDQMRVKREKILLTVGREILGQVYCSIAQVASRAAVITCRTLQYFKIFQELLGLHQQ